MIDIIGRARLILKEKKRLNGLNGFPAIKNIYICVGNGFLL